MGKIKREKEILNGSTDGLEKLGRALENYQHGTAGGHIDDALDHAQNTIECIRHYARGGSIEIHRNNYAPFSIWHITKINE